MSEVNDPNAQHLEAEGFVWVPSQSVDGWGRWSDPSWDALVEAGIHQGGRLPGHAGRFETSVIQALRPELVVEPRPHRDLPEGFGELRVSTPYRAEHHGWWASVDGYTDSPDLGTVAIGELSLAAVTGAVADAFVEFSLAAEQSRQ